MKTFMNVQVKVYPDGSEGNYFCKCCICDVEFVGRKRDINCGKDHKGEEGECKHCLGTGYLDNPLWMDDRDEVANTCFVCGGEG